MVAHFSKARLRFDVLSFVLGAPISTLLIRHRSASRKCKVMTFTSECVTSYTEPGCGGSGFIAMRNTSVGNADRSESL